MAGQREYLAACEENFALRGVQEKALNWSNTPLIVRWETQGKEISHPSTRHHDNVNSLPDPPPTAALQSHKYASDKIYPGVHLHRHHRWRAHRVAQHQSPSLPPKQQRPYMEADFEGLDPEFGSEDRAENHHNTPDLSGGSTNAVKPQQVHIANNTATDSPRERWEPGEDLRSIPRDIHRKNNRTSQIAENAGVDKPIRP
ncbi:hypothetical protein V8E54_000841 [Elaphomyces granulatus]